MNVFKISLLSLFVFCSFLLSVVSAEDVNKNVDSKQAITLATVSVSNYKIVSQDNNVFNISFNLTNRTGTQSGVKYGIVLKNNDPKNQIVFDEKVYPDSITLSEGSNISKAITYEAPKSLLGEYNLFLTSGNESGLSFGEVFLGKVNLKSSTDSLFIITPSCFLQVVGEKNEAHYLINQDIDISKDETLRLNCSVINQSNTALTVKPIYETRYRSSYGEVVPQNGGSNEAIVIKSKEVKTFSVVLPVSDSPQLYSVNMKLAGGDIVSNQISSTYILKGNAATITNLSLDKDAYQKGEQALLSFVYMPLPTTGSERIKNSDISSLEYVVKLAMTNDKGEECITPIEQKLTQDIANPKVEINASVIMDCFNPKIAATLLDNKGNVLDSKNYSVNSSAQTNKDEDNNSNGQLAIIIIASILVVVGISAYFINLKKKQNETNNI